MRRDPEEQSLYPPIHEKTPYTFSFERLDRLWDRYPQYHEMTTFSTMEGLLEEHPAWGEDFEDLREEYEAGQYDRFLIQLSWADLPYRYATRKLIEAAGADNSRGRESLRGSFSGAVRGAGHGPEGLFSVSGEFCITVFCGHGGL